MSTPISRPGAEIQRLVEQDPHTCPVCRFVGDAMQHHIDKLFYERVTDIQTREMIRKARGFCRWHAQMVSEYADALGTAIIMQDILINDLRSLDAGRMDRPPNTGRGIGRFFDTASRNRDARPPCPLCDVECEMDAMAIDDLLQALANTAFCTTYRASAGMCMPHFRLAFARAKDPDAWKIVLATQRQALASLTDELGELARKFDYRNRDERIGEESDSWRRGLDKTSGKAT